MLRLTRLRIHRFRHVSPGTELAFGDTFNVLLGKNGTGKTTLLMIASAIITDDLSVFEGEEGGFHLEYELTAHDGALMAVGIQQTAAARSAESPSRATRGHSHGQVRYVHGEVHRTWNIEGLRATEGERTFELEARLTEKSFRSLCGISRHNRNAGIYFPGPFDLPATAGRIDEAVDALQRFRKETLVVDDEGGPLWGSVSAGVFDVAQMTSNEDSVEITSAKSSFLSEVAKVLRFDSAKVRLALSESTSASREFDEPQLFFTRPDSSGVRHDFLSFGQKRMLAFLWACAMEGNHPIVADELINGLHHEWLELVMNEKLASRQSFLATQNPLLLDYIPIENVEDARHKFVRCTLETDANGRETMCWRNLNDDEAARLWSALEAGVQHVSEILRDEKLW